VTPETLAALAAWPRDWREYWIAVEIVSTRLGMSRRSVANRAAWLSSKGEIERLWVDFETKPPDVDFMTRRRPTGHR